MDDAVCRVVTSRIRCAEVDLIGRNVPSSQESAEHPGGRQASRRANIWRDSPNSEDGVECAGRRPIVKRDPSDRKGTERLGERGMAGSAPCSEESAKQPERYQMIGKGPSPQKDPAARRPSVA